MQHFNATFGSTFVTFETFYRRLECDDLRLIGFDAFPHFLELFLACGVLLFHVRQLLLCSGEFLALLLDFGSARPRLFQALSFGG